MEEIEDNKNYAIVYKIKYDEFVILDLRTACVDRGYHVIELYDCVNDQTLSDLDGYRENTDFKERMLKEIQRVSECHAKFLNGETW